MLPSLLHVSSFLHVSNTFSSIKYASISLFVHSHHPLFLSPRSSVALMAEQRPNYGQVQQQQHLTDAIKGMLPQSGPSKSQVVAVITLLPVGGTLLLISGLTLAGTLIGLAVTMPLFVIFSPVLVPAAIVIGLAIIGFLSSGAFGIIALAAFSWIANFLRKVGGSAPEQVENVKQRVQDTAGQIGQKTKEADQTIQSKAQEAKDEKRDRT